MRKFTKIILSNVANYQSDLEMRYIEYLRISGSSVKTQKNYRSDLSHFLTWMTKLLITRDDIEIRSLEQYIVLFTPHALALYRDEMIENQTPGSTINRRLSALRMFFQYCKHTGLLSDNPMIALRNVPKTITAGNEKEELVKDFEKYLVSEGASKKTIKNYLSDVKQYLVWLENQSKQQTSHNLDYR